MVEVEIAKCVMQGNVLTELWYMSDEDVFQGQTALLKVLKRPSKYIIHGKQKQTIDIVCKLIFLLFIKHKQRLKNHRRYTEWVLTIHVSLSRNINVRAFLIISASVGGFKQRSSRCSLLLGQKLFLFMKFICYFQRC